MFTLASTRRRAASLLPLVLALGLTATDIGAAEVLDFEQALVLAQQRSRQLAALDAAASAAKDMAGAAGQLPDPTLKAGVNNLPIDGPDRFSLVRDFMTMRSIGVMQEFTRADKRAARSARFEREADAARAARHLALANLQRDAAVSWLDRHFQERMRELLVAQREETKLQIEAAEAAYRSARGPQADVFAARATVAQIEDRIAQSERQIATATTQLARWVGPAADAPLGPVPAMKSVTMSLSDLETQLAHHPQIEALLQQEAMANADADMARANKRADWSAELMLSQRGPGYSTMVSFNLSVPLQWDQKNRQDRELAAKLALAEQARAQREEVTREHTAEARAMLQEWASDVERLRRYDSVLVPLAGERTKAALAAYRGGAGSLGAVLEARRGEIDTRMDRLRLEMDAARLWAQLNYLVPDGGAVVTHRP
ncbi:TolC family protein [Piscinibacter sp.]|uniref:TolC family protein n=1 Tax=Piscinibacter sp. TaxID=1903157 RepID=UPI00355960E8